METSQEATRCFEQILERALIKKAPLRPFAFHLKTILIRRKRQEKGKRSKEELITDNLLWTLTHGLTTVDRFTKTYMPVLCG